MNFQYIKKATYIFLIILFIASTAGCSRDTSNVSEAIALSGNYNLSNAASSGYDVEERNIDYVLDHCEAAILAEIIRCDEYYAEEREYTCRVIHDYFGNINFEGMESGYITVLEDDGVYKVGDQVFLFLNHIASPYFPYIVYIPADYYCQITLTNNNTLSFFAPDIEEFHYGLAEDFDLSEYIFQYAAQHEKRAIIGRTVYTNGETAREAADAMLCIAILERSEQTKYVDKIIANVVSVLKGTRDYEQNRVILYIPKEVECIIGKQYFVLIDKRDDLLAGNYSMLPYLES